MTPDIIPFETEMLPEAGTLLALRHQRIRELRPELPVAFEDSAAARVAVEAALRRDQATGVAAISGGRLRGYLIGESVVDNLWWGRSAWVRFAGCAVAPDHDPDLVRDLYATLAAGWVRTGCFTHFALMPAVDAPLIDRWFALCFGIEQVHGIVALDEVDLAPRPDPPGVEIRRAVPEDRPHLEELSDVIWRHQVQAPVWGIHLPEERARQRVECGGLAEDPAATTWLAFCQGQPAGVQVYWAEEAGADDPRIPEACIGLHFAGTRDWARGRGIGQALTRQGFTHARAAGYRYCLTDWRSTNLLSSRFWPRQGFRPVVYRLVRRVDPRIAWAGTDKVTR